MFKKIFRLFFLSLVFLSGVIVGGINTPKVIEYAFNQNHDVNAEELLTPKPQKQIKKTRRIIRALV
ncbi:MAG: hypothetical protein JKX75_03425 [Gammaproteobacteria bacterium]|nr:hypothetical protein [Gammaproteobacteria bacterium]